MNKISAVLGTILVLIAAFLFLIVFSGGSLGNYTITGDNPTLNFLAFVYVLIALPVGAGLAFYGYAVRKPVFAAGAGQQVVYKGRSGLASAALALAIIAILVGVGAIYYAGTVTPPTTTNTAINNLQGQVSAINAKLGAFATVNATPAVVPFKVDWCNTDNTGQDRFCPANIVVNQGDYVQILFIHNDTDAHTFTMIATYSFQINLTYGAPGSSGNFSTRANGMHNFLTSGFYQSSCVNNAPYSQQVAGVSPVDCVSGASLLPAITPPWGLFGIATNPTPASSFTPPAGPILINVTNQAYFISENASAPSPYTGAPPYYASWGIGAFQVTTPGIYEYFCHYHVSNGMFGYLIVLPNSYCSASASNAKACGLTTTG